MKKSLLFYLTLLVTLSMLAGCVGAGQPAGAPAGEAQPAADGGSRQNQDLLSPGTGTGFSDQFILIGSAKNVQH